MSDDEKVPLPPKAGLTPFEDLPATSAISDTSFADAIKTFDVIKSFESQRIPIPPVRPDPKLKIAREHLESSKLSQETLGQLANLTLDNVELARRAVESSTESDRFARTMGKVSTTIAIVSLLVAVLSVVIAILK